LTVCLHRTSGCDCMLQNNYKCLCIHVYACVSICLQVDVDVKFVKDVLRGDDCSELRVECRGAIETVMSDEYKEN
jgi:hypothetical protein